MRRIWLPCVDGTMAQFNHPELGGGGRALELQPDHKAAREYLGELYVQSVEPVRQFSDATPTASSASAARVPPDKEQRSPPSLWNSSGRLRFNHECYFCGDSR
jgi:hypothetical protein